MQEKTEKPSQRKLKKARERGEFAYSAELNFALVLAGGLGLLWLFSTVLSGRLKGIFIGVFSGLNILELEEGLKQVAQEIVVPLVVLLGGILVIALAAHWVQTGWVWSRKRGRKQRRSRLLFSLLKVIVIGGTGYFTLRSASPSLHPSPLHETLFSLLAKVALALLVLGVADFIYQKWRYYQSMRMTKQELKDEQRETEGDRQSKNKMSRR